MLTMDMSWGGWKAVSGLQEIRSSSWLVPGDHTVALELSITLQKFRHGSYAGYSTGDQ